MTLGEPDQSGRRKPVPVEGSQFVVPLDTLLVAVGEEPDVRFLGRGHEVQLAARGNTVLCDDVLATSIPGVFAGGDVVSGPDTVLDAMAAGKLAAEMIDKHVRGQPLVQDFGYLRPSTCVPPTPLSEEEATAAERPVPPSLPVEAAARQLRRGRSALDRGNGRARSAALPAVRPATGRGPAAVGATTVRDEQRRSLAWMMPR